MLADAMSFLGSAVFLRRIKSPEPPVEPEGGSIRGRFAAGLAFVIRDPIIRPSMLAVATINLFNFAFSALFILYATETLGVSPGALGLALGVGAIGGLLGAVVASRIGRQTRSRPGLRARLHHLPGVADPRADRRARDADAGDPRPDPRLGVRGGTRAS